LISLNIPYPAFYRPKLRPQQNFRLQAAVRELQRTGRQGFDLVGRSLPPSCANIGCTGSATSTASHRPRPVRSLRRVRSASLSELLVRGILGRRGLRSGLALLHGGRCRLTPLSIPPRLIVLRGCEWSRHGSGHGLRADRIDSSPVHPATLCRGSGVGRIA
jgi:hypothetical protein